MPLVWEPAWVCSVCGEIVASSKRTDHAKEHAEED